MTGLQPEQPTQLPRFVVERQAVEKAIAVSGQISDLRWSLPCDALRKLFITHL
jgi:hypothetical protein